MNAMHASMKITDEFYSKLNDDEIKERLAGLSRYTNNISEDEELVKLIKDFLKK